MRGYADEHKKLLEEISKQELYISKARKYFLEDRIDFGDFSKLKKEHNEMLDQLNHQLDSITKKLAGCDDNNNFWPDTNFNVFQSYKEQDIKGKRDLISLFTPISINPITINIGALEINEAISLIVGQQIEFDIHPSATPPLNHLQIKYKNIGQLQYKNPGAFSARKVSVDQAIKLLGRNGIGVDREKAVIILDFIYLMAKTYKTRKGQ